MNSLHHGAHGRGNMTHYSTLRNRDTMVQRSAAPMSCVSDRAGVTHTLHRVTQHTTNTDQAQLNLNIQRTYCQYTYKHG